LRLRNHRRIPHDPIRKDQEARTSKGCC
jgi:hypothetical protein